MRLQRTRFYRGTRAVRRASPACGLAYLRSRDGAAIANASMLPMSASCANPPHWLRAKALGKAINEAIWRPAKASFVNHPQAKAVRLLPTPRA